MAQLRHAAAASNNNQRMGDQTTARGASRKAMCCRSPAGGAAACMRALALCSPVPFGGYVGYALQLRALRWATEPSAALLRRAPDRVSLVCAFRGHKAGSYLS